MVARIPKKDVARCSTWLVEPLRTASAWRSGCCRRPSLARGANLALRNLTRYPSKPLEDGSLLACCFDFWRTASPHGLGKRHIFHLLGNRMSTKNCTAPKRFQMTTRSFLGVCELLLQCFTLSSSSHTLVLKHVCQNCGNLRHIVAQKPTPSTPSSICSGPIRGHEFLYFGWAQGSRANVRTVLLISHNSGIGICRRTFHRQMYVRGVVI